VAAVLASSDERLEAFAVKWETGGVAAFDKHVGSPFKLEIEL
jgi:hypothetical protein